jgi:hypothetical protein
MPHIEFDPPKPHSGLPELGLVDFRIEHYPHLNGQQKQLLMRAFSQGGVLALYRGGGHGGTRWLLFSNDRVSLATPAQVSDPNHPRLPPDWEKYMVSFNEARESLVPPRSSKLLYQEIARLRELMEKTFHDHYHLKNQLIDVKFVDLTHDPELLKELYGLIQTAYAGIGGNLKIRNARDLLGGEITLIHAADIDEDPQADVMFYGRKTTAGFKFGGMGHDGSSHAKMYAMAKAGDLLKKSGNYGEFSGALAHILIAKSKIPSVNDHKRVERILGKKVQWVGSHPEGKYPTHAGWYVRSIGDGGTHMKILLGQPT